MCKVWLGRTEGKEGEKSNPLTSKSCTTGTSREGGHAATKHRETEITITEATAAASTQPQSQGCQRGVGSSVWRAMPARDLGAGKKQSPVLSGTWTSSLAPRTTRTTRKPRPDGSDSKAGKDKLLGITILAGGHSGGHCAAAQGPTLQNRPVQLTVPRPSVVSYLGDLMGLS